MTVKGRRHHRRTNTDASGVSTIGVPAGPITGAIDRAAVMQLLRRGGGSGQLGEPGVRDTPGDDTGGARIRCPQCAWQPGRHHTWACECLHEWNTFETGGVCPACQRQWLETQCPQCDTWSPHLAWYVEEDGSGTH